MLKEKTKRDNKTDRKKTQKAKMLRVHIFEVPKKLENKLGSNICEHARDTATKSTIENTTNEPDVFAQFP